MPVEIEIKLKVQDHDGLRIRLRERKGQPLGTRIEMNHIFDRPDRSLLAAGYGLRLRCFLDQEGVALPGGVLTAKGPTRAGSVKVREEIETRVDGAPQTAELLTLIGFTPVLIYQKRRERWRFQACQIELDEVPYLGRFVEIEGPGEDRIQSARRALGLETAAVEPRSYVAMLLEFRDQSQLGNIPLVLNSELAD